MRTSTAIKLSAQWHNGQWSSLYQFASSGVYLMANCLRYLQEVESCLHPEYNLYPGFLNKKDEKDLNNLKQYFIREAKRICDIDIQYSQHPVYGYLIPFLAGWTPISIC